jgi:hypothetical protein
VAYLRRDPGDEVTPPGMVDPQFYKRDNDTVESLRSIGTGIFPNFPHRRMLSSTSMTKPLDTCHRKAGTTDNMKTVLEEDKLYT